ncbi:hypothetical protein BD324DRAFT_614892 [Kockovaella imperatae]|uniref:CNH domain-domain-containing protein n=1 Tax=Kockovaella imperatae TaxID=4999 RepID=A0A1Y1UP40_9TREE|nr:hypothetical protein BD324DRAFT_614892 [Kockovaella imperatae]ORX39762.1 hypothetical protein BD324DRAFT_614892 [Kockovaella imperatae]
MMNSSGHNHSSSTRLPVVTAKGHARHSSYNHTHLRSSPTYRPAPPPPTDVTPTRRPPPPTSFSQNNVPSYPNVSPSAAGPSRPMNARVSSAPTRALPDPPAPFPNPFSTPSPSSKSAMQKLRPWSMAADRTTSGNSRWSDRSSGSTSDQDRNRASGSPSPAEYSNGDSSDAQDLTVKLGKGFAQLDMLDTDNPRSDKGWPWTKPKRGNNDSGVTDGLRPRSHHWGNDYGDVDTDDDTQPDAYSWIDPSLVGREKLRVTVSSVMRNHSTSFADSSQPTRKSTRSTQSAPSSPATTVSRTIIDASREPLPDPSTPKTKGTHIDPTASYNLLLAFQSSTSSSGHDTSVISPKLFPLASPSASSDHIQLIKADPEWHELVGSSFFESLGSAEVRRQGLWWELVKGEVEYVRDLRTVCDVSHVAILTRYADLSSQSFIKPLRDRAQPLIKPESRLQFFIDEVFSCAPALREAHERLLLKLLERQRYEWPLLTSGTDLLLQHFLEHVSLYEQYMKNYPFAEARVRREKAKNPGFRNFLEVRNTTQLTRKRDLSVFLSRPITRLPRLLLLLEALLRITPEDHPDHEEIPTVSAILTGALKASQPGIESAEAKIRLWNVAERMMFRKGEIVELDIGDPKRTLVYAGHVFRRVRTETNWHGWQDLHAFLLDNYFILTRDEEGGKYVVVSRPIHLDFLTLETADGVPERRYDYLNTVRRHARSASNQAVERSERLMYPFTVSSEARPSNHSYTLCTATANARAQWKEKIENAKALRAFDAESNRLFAIHSIFIPPEIADPILAADTFKWLGRETICVATMRSLWFGWRRDSRSYRELIRFSSGFITSVSVVPEFGWLLVLISGSLIAYSLNELVPTHEPLTWQTKSRGGGYDLSAHEQPTAFVRVGVTKGRTMVVHVAYAKNSHQTHISFEEPLLASNPDRSYATTPFRRFAALTIPGFATDLSFFKQTVAIVTEKGFVIAEAGNPTFNAIPTFPLAVQGNSHLMRVLGSGKPMAMYQVAENEFALVYDWGASFVTKYGEIARDGSFIRWNVTPSYVAFRPPYLLLFEETGGRAEVREVGNGRMCEVVRERGMQALRLSRADQDMLAICPKGLLEIVETFALPAVA